MSPCQLPWNKAAPPFPVFLYWLRGCSRKPLAPQGLHLLALGKAHGTVGMGLDWLGTVSLVSLPLAGVRHETRGILRSAARGPGPTSDSDSSWDAALR